MQYRDIPNTTLRPSVLCLGCGQIGSTIPRAESLAMLDIYTAEGGNLLDTAAVYGNWAPGEPSVSERTIGQWLRARGGRDQIIVVTKGGHPALDGLNRPRLSRAEVEGDLHASLRNLQVDAVDLYYVHRDDPARPIAEIMEMLHDFVLEGHVRHLGCSNWRAERISAAQSYAADRGWQPFVANQPLWSLAPANLHASPDPTLVQMDAALCRYHIETGMACLPYSSQAYGLFQRLAAGTLDGMNAGQRALYDNPESTRRFVRAQRLVSETGLSLSQIVLGYLIAQPFPTFPIVGSRNVIQLRDTLTAADVQLCAAQVAFLEAGEG